MSTVLALGNIWGPWIVVGIGVMPVNLFGVRRFSDLGAVDVPPITGHRYVSGR